jgi:hypothetical protein
MRLPLSQIVEVPGDDIAIAARPYRGASSIGVRYFGIDDRQRVRHRNPGITRGIILQEVRFGNPIVDISMDSSSAKQEGIAGIPFSFPMVCRVSHE